MSKNSLKSKTLEFERVNEPDYKFEADKLKDENYILRNKLLVIHMTIDIVKIHQYNAGVYNLNLLKAIYELTKSHDTKPPAKDPNIIQNRHHR